MAWEWQTLSEFNGIIWLRLNLFLNMCCSVIFIGTWMTAMLFIQVFYLYSPKVWQGNKINATKIGFCLSVFFIFCLFFRYLIVPQLVSPFLPLYCFIFLCLQYTKGHLSSSCRLKLGNFCALLKYGHFLNDLLCKTVRSV